MLYLNVMVVIITMFFVTHIQKHMDIVLMNAIQVTAKVML